MRVPATARSMDQPTRVSFWIVAATLALVGWLHLGTPLLVALFSLFVLDRLRPLRNRWLAVSAFLLLLVAASYVVAHFVAQAVVALPAVAGKAIPSIIDYAQILGFELPFTDWASLKEVTLHAAREQAAYLAGFATVATRELVFVLVGIAVAVGLYLNPTLDIDRDVHPLRDNFYSHACEAVAERFRRFYASFRAVMGAQILISAINTALTSIFVFAVGLPNAAVVVGVTFLCGLVPVVGNLVSNTVITAIAFTVSPRMALLALAFLVVIHKLEYFLNGKIIGDRIRNPVWLTLLALLLGEKLMGIPGMILAPVVLHYVRAEGLRVRVERDAPRAAAMPVEVVLASPGPPGDAVAATAEPPLSRAAG